MHSVKATTINDAWHQAVYLCWKHGYDHKIDSGSYCGQLRRQFDFFACEITNPETRPLAIQFPELMSVPPPNSETQIEDYAANYLLNSDVTNKETYTYGSRMLAFPNSDGSKTNQVEWIIEHLKKYPGNNHCAITIPMGGDLLLDHAPCLRTVDLKAVNGKLNIAVYFRSWDLWSGFPTNLGGFQIFNEFIAQEVGIPTGKMFAASAGLHLYEMYFDVVRLRLNDPK
jgi:thymidylate synthase